MRGLKFYAENGVVALQTELDWDDDDYEIETVCLEDGERVICYRSRRSPKFPNLAIHCDFQLIIGRKI